jgi:hypothetical protein
MNMCFGLDRKGVDGYKDGEGNGPVCDDRMGAGIVPELCHCREEGLLVIRTRPNVLLESDMHIEV